MDWFELRDIARALVLPPAGPLGVACLGFVLMWLDRWKRIGAWLCGLGIATLWVLAMPIVSAQLMRIATPYETLDLGRPLAADAVVILAGGVRRYAPEYNQDVPNEITWQRLAYGARLARVTGLPVLVTGGRGEAAAMRDFLVTDFGISPRWVEEDARDTSQNAANTRTLLEADGVRSVLLVTSDWHMRRAVLEFEWHGMRVVPAPVTDYSPPDGMLARWLPGAGALSDSRTVLNEWLGTLVLRVRHYMAGGRSPVVAPTG